VQCSLCLAPSFSLSLSLSLSLCTSAGQKKNNKAEKKKLGVAAWLALGNGAAAQERPSWRGEPAQRVQRVPADAQNGGWKGMAEKKTTKNKNFFFSFFSRITLAPRPQHMAAGGAGEAK